MRYKTLVTKKNVNVGTPRCNYEHPISSFRSRTEQYFILFFFLCLIAVKSVRGEKVGLSYKKKKLRDKSWAYRRKEENVAWRHVRLTRFFLFFSQ